MPRFNDRLLLAGAMIIMATGLGLSCYNLAHGFNPQNGLTVVFGTLIALGCALIAIGIDLQNAVTARLGVLANTSILQCWQGWACLLGWGAFNVAMFQIVLLYPQWASETFHFEVGSNLLSAGVLVGVSAMIIIRSKLMKVNNIEWGVEWLYLWSSAQSLSAVNRKRIATKSAWESKFRPYVTDLAKYPNFFTDLETHLVNFLRGCPPNLQAALQQEFSQLRATYIPPGSPTPDAIINASVPARRYLVSAVLDHLGHGEILLLTATLPSP
ncbi:hypothetical protein NLM16_05735 [Bradyrhizobium brasilense]|uniref:hypothetical protein n=1 Tax=Bradyrhizobium brasilense TaxID=1419277 RepID=UPI0028780803|nr:hypothetical protein [Bradyrhizobium brasilense]MCP3413597.1 hypothetical protein [Bradyrhizobium brasilense]